MKEKYRRRPKTLLMLTLIVFAALILSTIFTSLTVSILVHSGSEMIHAPEEIRAELYQLIMVIGMISVPIALIISIFFTVMPLKPIMELIDGMNRLAAGDFQTRIVPGPMLKYNIVFTEVVDSFNDMAQELEHTELLRTDFINNFSHEFKTPIVSIAGFARLLNRGKLPEDAQKEYLTIIEEESMRLSYMATNVLNLTRVENQAILTGAAEYNLSEQIRSCILLLEKKWEKKNLDFRLRFEEHTIRGSEELLKEVWINLLDNAIKFSSDNQLIDVSIREHWDGTEVSIRNTGVEITQDQQKRIFQKFYQADESHAAEGNGIGLAIVKKVVELHKGTILVRSRDGETTFTVSLPR